VIEDAAQAIGAEDEGRRAGSMGRYGCLSFFPSKNLGCFGDGGMIVSHDEEVIKKIKTLRNHGSEKKYYYKTVGGNFRLDALQAVVLIVKLKYLDEWTEKRILNAKRYDRFF
jgi:dTDP-4-amino-4,6-dideoxygalactose transaminase